MSYFEVGILPVVSQSLSATIWMNWEVNPLSPRH